jgi:methionyl-tRNA synthetase
LEPLYYPTIAKLRELPDKQKEILETNSVKKRQEFIDWYFQRHLLAILKIIVEQGYFAQDLPFQLQDKDGSITKKVYYCFCNSCQTYFARFGRKANTCFICKKRERFKKLAEQQQIRRLISEGLTPRYCENCGKLLPDQKHRKNKKYCGQPCQQKAYHARKNKKFSPFS